MGWWFGRKSAPADARPFVPAWLQNNAAEEGFACSYQAQFQEVYRRNPVGQRSVRLIAGMLGGLTIDGDARAVRLVKAGGLLEGIAANLLLHGNAYTHKPYVHFYATQSLDMLVAGAVEEPPLATPPSSPALGACYIVAAAATGAWTGKSECVAAWTSGGWRFASPVEGMSLYERTSGTWATYGNGGWALGNVRGAALFINNEQVIGPRGSAIASPAGGSIVDSEARTTIEAILGAMRQHGLIET